MPESLYPLSATIEYFVEERLCEAPNIVSYAWIVHSEAEALEILQKEARTHGHERLYRVYKCIE